MRIISSIQSFNSRGFAPVLIAVGILSVLAAMNLVTAMSSGILNKKTVERLNRVEAFYSGELLAWHAHERSKAGLSISGPVNFDNNYAATLEGVSEGGDGLPYNIIATKQLIPGSRLIRRLNSERFLAEERGTERCGKVGFSGTKKNYRVCLEMSPEEPSKAVLYVSYQAIGGDGQGVNIRRVLDNGEVDPEFGTNGYSRIRGIFGNGFEPRPHFVTRSNGSLLFIAISGLFSVKPDGTLDLNFGTNGKVVMPFQMVDYSIIGSQKESIGSDDSYFVFPGDSSKVHYLKTLANGTFDLTYGDKGWFKFNPCPDGCSLTLQQNYTTTLETIIRYESVTYVLGQALLIIGTGGANNVTNPYILSIGHDGKMMTSFGSQGSAEMPIEFRVYCLTRLSDGKLLVLAQRNGWLIQQADSKYVFFRFLPDGSRDTQFGNNGMLEFGKVLGRPHFDPKSRLILVSMEVLQTKTVYKYLRYLPNGFLDSSFGSGGTAKVVELPSKFPYSAQLLNILFHVDGTIFSAFKPADDPGNMSLAMGEKKIYLHHLLENGTPDPHFGNNGLSEISLPEAPVVWAFINFYQ